MKTIAMKGRQTRDRPTLVTMMLSLRRSPIPSTYVATQYPAVEYTKLWICSASETSAGRFSASQFATCREGKAWRARNAVQAE